MSKPFISPDEYVANLEPSRQDIIAKIRQVLLENLPEGFEEGISYGMLGYYVPHSIYPAGYHCAPKDPLPFIGLASQKSHIGLYHMGLYASPEDLAWFQTRWKDFSAKKLDMGKSCIRFKKAEDVPLDLIKELVGRMTVDKWIDIYEKNVKK